MRRTPRSLARPLTLAASALLLAGCPSLSLHPPQDFVLLEPSRGYTLRATNAEGVVLAVRELDNDPQGTLTFWSNAVGGRLRALRGYVPMGEEPVTAASGQTGRRLSFTRAEGEQPYAYGVSVFVIDDRVVVVEEGGRLDDVQRSREALDLALGSLRLE